MFSMRYAYDNANTLRHFQNLGLFSWRPIKPKRREKSICSVAVVSVLGSNPACKL